MNVSLTPELDSYVYAKVQSGRYNSASEVLREALRLMQDQDELKQLQLDELRKNVSLGLEDLDQNRHTVGTIADFEAATLARGRALLASRRKASA